MLRSCQGNCCSSKHVWGGVTSSLQPARSDYGIYFKNERKCSAFPIRKCPKRSDTNTCAAQMDANTLTQTEKYTFWYDWLIWRYISFLSAWGAVRRRRNGTPGGCDSIHKNQEQEIKCSPSVLLAMWAYLSSSCRRCCCSLMRNKRRRRRAAALHHLERLQPNYTPQERNLRPTTLAGN